MASNRRTFLLDREAGITTVPAEALRFDAGPFTLAGKQAADGNRPVSMLARTADPIDNWYWGKVVHDMAGMKLAAPTLPIDYCHDREQILGYLDQFAAGNDGLNVSGQLVQFKGDDRTAEVCFKADAGVPYQASIEFDPSTYVLECLREGFQATVNGRQLEGPACIIRQWTLVAVAICPCGADAGTRTQLAAGAQADVPVQFVSPTKDPAAMDPNKPAATETKPATELAAPAVTALPADPRAEFQATLTKFAAKFGAANGAAWAAEGLSYEQALEKHAEAIASQLTAEQGKTKDLETKLAAVPRGEAAPVSFSSGDKRPEGGNPTSAPPNKFAHLGNVGKFAASIAGKLPTK